MEKALNLQEEDMNRKHVSSHSDIFLQKAQSLYQDFSKNSLKQMIPMVSQIQEQVWIEKGRRERG